MLERVENYNIRLFLVSYLLNHLRDVLSLESYNRLYSEEMAIKILVRLPPADQERVKHLTKLPNLIVESLLMDSRIERVFNLMREFPELQSDSLALTYAAKGTHAGECASVAPAPRPGVVVQTCRAFSFGRQCGPCPALCGPQRWCSPPTTAASAAAEATVAMPRRPPPTSATTAVPMGMVQGNGPGGALETVSRPQRVVGLSSVTRGVFVGARKVASSSIG